MSHFDLFLCPFKYLKARLFHNGPLRPVLSDTAVLLKCLKYGFNYPYFTTTHLVDASDVARVQPPVLVNRLSGLLRVQEVFLHTTRAFHAHLPPTTEHATARYAGDVLDM